MSLFHSIFYTCEEASTFAIRSSQEKIPLTKRFKLKIHLLFCEACKRFNIQNKWIDDHLHKMEHVDTIHKLSHVSKARLTNILHAEIESNN